MRRTLTIVALVAVMLLVTTGAVYARPDAWYTICAHRVRRGETLLCIARAYGVRWRAVATYNGLANPNRIRVGQLLYIPNAYGSNPAGRVCTRQCDGGGGCSCRWYHTVQAGQNLYRISRLYGVNMWRIAQCNNILNLNRIYVGQRLCIP